MVLGDRRKRPRTPECASTRAAAAAYLRLEVGDAQAWHEPEGQQRAEPDGLDNNQQTAARDQRGDVWDV